MDKKITSSLIKKRTIYATVVPPLFTSFSRKKPLRVLPYPCPVTGTPVAAYSLPFGALLTECIRCHDCHCLTPTDNSLEAGIHASTCFCSTHLDDRSILAHHYAKVKSFFVLNKNKNKQPLLCLFNKSGCFLFIRPFYKSVGIKYSEILSQTLVKRMCILAEMRIHILAKLCYGLFTIH